jgi:hypothetical protein
MNSDRKILLSSRWVAVTSEDMMAKSKIFDFTQGIKFWVYNPNKGKRHFIPLPQSLPPGEGS